MDTRFWGPDGWKLLHSIAENYPDKPSNLDKDTYSIFFLSLQHVLPCIYCRKSFTQYINELCIDEYLDSKEKLVEWLYKIHNKVNEKLWSQGLNNNCNPDLKDIRIKYKKYLENINNMNCIGMPGWDFLYAIVFNYPEYKKNLQHIRYINYVIFFKYLCKVLPFISVREYFSKISNETNFEYVMESRYKLKLWFYNSEKKIKKFIDCKCIKYSERCQLIEKHRAGCGGNKDIKPTCRVGNTRK